MSNLVRPIEYRCWYCGDHLIWDVDHSLEDITGIEDEVGIVTYLHCPSCHAEVTYVLRYSED